MLLLLNEGVYGSGLRSEGWPFVSRAERRRSCGSGERAAMAMETVPPGPGRSRAARRYSESDHDHLIELHSEKLGNTRSSCDNRRSIQLEQKPYTNHRLRCNITTPGIMLQVHHEKQAESQTASSPLPVHNIFKLQYYPPPRIFRRHNPQRPVQGPLRAHPPPQARATLPNSRRQRK